MPSITLAKAEDKKTIKEVIGKNKILTATVARLYFAHPDPNRWNYSNIMGAVAFVFDHDKNSYYFRFVDLMNKRGVLWGHELYTDFQYNQDCSYFHSFASDKYMIGFSFVDENEANSFYNKVIKKEKHVKAKKSKNPNKSGILGGKKNKKKNGIDKSLISVPTEFRHLGHIGFNSDDGFVTQNIDPAWKDLVDELDKLGVSEEEVKKNASFIKEFLNENKSKARPIPAPTRRQTKLNPVKQKVPPAVPARKSVLVSSTSTNSNNNNNQLLQDKILQQKQQSSASITHQKIGISAVIPPLAPSNSTKFHHQSKPSFSSPLPPPIPPQITSPPVSFSPPPPPPNRHTNSQPQPPSPPARVQNQSTIPPPPARVQTQSTVPPPPPRGPIIAQQVIPPQQSSNNSRSVSPVPPPPPPPPPPPSSHNSRGVSSGPPLPPPPPPLPSSSSNNTSVELPEPSDSRSGLLAAIRNVGGVSGANLRKVIEPTRQLSIVEEPTSPTSGGNDLARALASAIKNRSTALRNDSDDEEEDDDDEWDDD